MVVLHFRAQRLEKNIRLYVVAKALGRTEGWLSRLERGEYRPTLQLAEDYGRVIDCDPRTLFSFSEYPFPYLGS